MIFWFWFLFTLFCYVCFVSGFFTTTNYATYVLSKLLSLFSVFCSFLTFYKWNSKYKWKCLLLLLLGINVFFSSFAFVSMNITYVQINIFFVLFMFELAYILTKRESNNNVYLACSEYFIFFSSIFINFRFFFLFSAFNRIS